MSLLENFLKTIEGAGKSVFNAIKNSEAARNTAKDAFSLISLGPVRQGISKAADLGISALGTTPEDAARQDNETELRQKLQKALGEVKQFDTNLVQKSNDLILKTAVKLNDEVISPYVTRPISTLGLLTDTNSPLYQPGEYDAGFQVSDIKRAYERSQYVSPMQALTKSNLIPFVGTVSDVILGYGGVDVDKVNLFDDQSVKEAFTDNIVGRWYTGIGDFFAANAALGAAGKVVNMGAKAAVSAAGFNTSKAVSEIEKLARDGFRYADTNGAEGSFQTIAVQMQELADTKDIARIADIIEPYTTNARIIPALRDASTKEAALDIILADKGNIDAMIRLSKTDPDHLFEIADVNGQIRAKNLLSDSTYQPDATAAERIRTAWESAIARDERFSELRKAFLDDAYQPVVGGRIDYIPGTPRYFKEPYADLQKFARDIRVQGVYNDFTDFAHVAELKFGTRVGGILVNTFKFVNKGAGYKPIGLVTNSGMRPMDARIELNAFFDDMEIFRDGARDIEVLPGKFEKASDIRKAFEARVINVKSDAELTSALETIDKSIGRIIAYNNGFYEDATIDAFYASFRANMRTKSEAFQKNGYAYNYDGSIDTTDAKSLRQFTESYQFTPWNHMEREFEKIKATGFAAGTKLTGSALKSFYEDLTKIWTFNVLARPMFIVKQSIAEPLISVGLAAGSDVAFKAAKTVAGRSLALGRNKIMAQAALVLNRSELMAVNQTVESLSTSASKAVAIKDMLQAEYETILEKGSPAIREQHLPQVRKELKAASKLVDDLEAELLAATKPYGKMETIPSMTTLQRRLSWIESNATPTEKAQMAAGIANAKAAIGQYKGTINSMATNRKVIQDAEDKLAAAYDEIDKAYDVMGLNKKIQADMWGRSAKYKKAYLGKTTDYRFINGQWVNLNSFVNDVNGNNFVRAVKAEVGNARTVEMNFVNELSVGARKAIIERKVPNAPITPTSANYYEELTHIANNYFRQEPLIDLILAEKSISDLLRWGLSPEGKNYFSHFGKYTDNEILGAIEDRVALVKRTFPSAEVRAIMLEREINAQELQSMLAPFSNRLYQINPTDFAYAENAIFGNKWWTNIENGLNSAASKVFRLLTTPENAIRETYFDKLALDKLAEKADYLAKQGLSMDVKQYNALRQSAGREALQEMEKTLYTVRRQNRLLYASRAAVAFPTATLNAFYRYGRLAAKNPGRSVQFLNNYQAAFRTFGVDKNGNPTRNVDEIAFLVVPGSRDIPFLKGNGDGIMLNAKSIGFMLNQWPSPSAISAISAGTIMKAAPTTEEGVKKALGPLWDVWFPYGAPTSVTRTFMPPWVNAAYNAVTGSEGKADFMASWRSVYDYHKMLIELGIESKFPSESQIKLEAQKLWEQKARWAFMSPFGVPIKVSTNKMDLVDTLWYSLMNKYTKQNLSYADAKTAAGDEMLRILGPNFMLDRVALRTSTARFNVPETPEAWDILFKDNTDLVKSIANIKQGDISLLGVLTGDLRVNYEDRNLSIVNKLRDPNLKLPGTSELVNQLSKNPMEIEDIRMKNRAWQLYTAVKEQLMVGVPEGKTLRSYPGKQAALEYLANTQLKDMSETFWNEYQNSRSGNSAWEYARAFQLAIGNDKFMKSRKDSQYWKDIQEFMAIRKAASEIYDAFPTGDRRKKIFLDAYLTTIDTFSANVHPELKQIIGNYFDNDNLKAVS